MIERLNSNTKRLLLIWLFLFFASIALGVRIYHLQFVEAERLQSRAKSQQQLTVNPYIPRRSIVDAQGNVLATDRLVYELYVHPNLFNRSSEEVAQKLADVLDHRSESDLLTRFQEQGSGIRLEENLREEVAAEIKSWGWNGIDLWEKYARYYPYEELGSNVVGYVQKDDHQGKTGVEFTQQELLTRVGESLSVERTARGGVLPASLPENAMAFDEKKLQLTLNLDLQRLSHQALKKQMQEFNAKRGTVIVMDVETGELVSLVTEPSYNPNRYFNSDLEEMRNWAVTDLYEPGSTFKPINIAIALEGGLINPNTEVYDPGKMEIGGWTIRNHDYFSNGGHGRIGLDEVLQVSSNVGMMKIVERMSSQYYHEQLKKLELEQPVGIDLMGETPGHLKSEFEFTNYPIEPAVASFGQGFSLTPIKLAQLHGAIANGGRLVTPHVVKGLVDQEGAIVEQEKRPEKQVFSPQTSQQVLQMMETVVSEGSGQVAKIPGYRSAGKTGTAQKANMGSYRGNGKITSYVSIFPVETPRYVVLAVVDEPKKPLAYGSTVAAPIVRDIMEGIITIEGIPPTHPEEFEEEEENDDA